MDFAHENKAHLTQRYNPSIGSNFYFDHQRLLKEADEQKLKVVND